MSNKKKSKEISGIYLDLSDPKVYEKFVRSYAKLVAPGIRRVELYKARSAESAEG